MRLLLGLLLLLSLFTLALVWQARTAQPSSAAEKRARDAGSLARAYPSDWGRIIVGAPSGAEPVEAPPPAVAQDRTPAPRAAPRPAAAPPQRAPREFEFQVQRGQTLSGICQAHYKTARAEVVEAVARYNQLRDAASVREGQKLRLPPLDSLLQR